MTRTWCMILLVGDAGLVVLHLLFGARFDLFNLDRERTFGALYSALLFLGCAYATTAMVFLSETRKAKLFWIALTSFFVFVGFDEISELHENIVYYILSYVPKFSFFHSGTPMWVLFLSPFILFACGLLLVMIAKIWKYKQSAGLCAAVALVLVLGALLFEFVGGLTVAKPYLFLLVTLEEGFEILSGTLFLVTLISYAKAKFFATFQRNEHAVWNG